MTRVDFYVLPDPGVEAARRFACRLAYRAVTASSRIYVLTDSEADSRDLDELMWTYPDQQFLPHEVSVGDEQSPEGVEVVIGHAAPADDAADVLINLSGGVPAFFGRFERVAEIITEATRDAGRDRYKHYRDRGYPLYHHELNDWEAG